MGQGRIGGGQPNFWRAEEVGKNRNHEPDSLTHLVRPRKLAAKRKSEGESENSEKRNRGDNEEREKGGEKDAAKDADEECENDAEKESREGRKQPAC